MEARAAPAWSLAPELMVLFNAKPSAVRAGWGTYFNAGSMAP